jgi:rhodanese-related sulfurtransferase
MKRIILSAVLSASALVSTVSFACEGVDHAALMEPKKVTVTELASWTKEKKATAVDANGQKTREKEGVIPGAVLLTSSSEYAIKELPTAKDSRLVFYCANSKCGASHTAAKRATEAGYTNVAVMPDGISGWKKSGLETTKPNT